MKKILKALYENRRLLVLKEFKQNPEDVPAALAYAYDNRLAPIFHEQELRELCEGSDLFEEAYSVKSAFVEEVVKYVDDLWLKKDFKSLGFYALEDHFGGKDLRIDLKVCLEYFRLDGRFDDELWSAVEKNAPAECNRIKKLLRPHDVSYF